MARIPGIALAVIVLLRLSFAFALVSLLLGVVGTLVAVGGVRTGKVNSVVLPVYPFDHPENIGRRSIPDDGESVVQLKTLSSRFSLEQ